MKPIGGHFGSKSGVKPYIRFIFFATLFRVAAEINKKNWGSGGVRGAVNSNVKVGCEAERQSKLNDRRSRNVTFLLASVVY